MAPFDGVPATIDREPITGPMPWAAGQQIAIGNTLIGLAPYEPPDAALHPSDDGAGINFNRPPRLLPAPGHQVQAAPPPDKQHRRSLPVLTALAPLADGRGLTS